MAAAVPSAIPAGPSPTGAALPPQRTLPALPPAPATTAVVTMAGNMPAPSGPQTQSPGPTPQGASGPSSAPPPTRAVPPDLPSLRVAVAATGVPIPVSRGGYCWSWLAAGGASGYSECLDTSAPDPSRATPSITLAAGTTLRLDFTPPPNPSSATARVWFSQQQYRDLPVASDRTITVQPEPGVHVYTIGGTWSGGHVSHGFSVRVP